MTYRVVIAAGGTGGHLFPAQALAMSLREKFPGIEITFMARGLSSHPHFQRELFHFNEVQASTLKKTPWTFIWSAAKIIQGTFQSLNFLKNKYPDLVIGFGSYHAFPVLMASYLASIPFILHEANTVPGKVNRFFSKRALWTGLFFPEAKYAIQGRTKPVSLPLRKGYGDQLTPMKKDALLHFGFKNDKKTLLIFGGSQGAQSINLMFLKAVEKLPELKNMQILHFTGNAALTEQAKKVYEKLGITHSVKDFEKEMNMAWAAADLCITRSGAATIAEQIAFQVPGILIPYPYAADNHQHKNAEFVQKELHAGFCLPEKSLTVDTLVQKIRSCLDEASLQKMQSNLGFYQTRLKAHDFCDAVIKTLEEMKTSNL